MRAEEAVALAQELLVAEVDGAAAGLRRRWIEQAQFRWIASVAAAGTGARGSVTARAGLERAPSHRR